MLLKSSLNNKSQFGRSKTPIVKRVHINNNDSHHSSSVDDSNEEENPTAGKRDTPEMNLNSRSRERAPTVSQNQTIFMLNNLSPKFKTNLDVKLAQGTLLEYGVSRGKNEVFTN
jgi:hypothetical protein